MAVFEFDYSAFNDLVKKVEELGLSEQEIAKAVLDSADSAAMEAYKANVPYGKPNANGTHARDHVSISKMGKSKNGNYYKVIGAGKAKGAKIDTEEFRYLFYVENGTSKMVARPFMDKAQAAVTAAALPKMKKTLEQEIEKRCGGGR